MIATIVTLVLAAVDPCAPVQPAAVRDREGAAACRKVGDAERSAGSQETAAVACRAALARDPSDAASRRALSEAVPRRWTTG